MAVGDDADAAERGFAARALAARSGSGRASAAPSGRYSPGADEAHPIIGLFPEAGG